ncbi:unnamed protein product [Camellia sinensis]
MTKTYFSVSFSAMTSGCVGGNFQLHYANESFFGTLDVTGNIWKYNAKNVSDDELGWFISVVNDMLHKLSRLAAFNLSYDFTKEKQVYGQEVRLHEIGDPNKIDVHHQNLQARDNLNSQLFPFIDLATPSAATDNFLASNKLGQGGVNYLMGGKFSSCSEQGLDEFTNEVLLILKLQHKNLVRLLGFCTDGEEKLPMNTCPMILGSVHAQMNWSRRLNMINGIVREMLYLHQDSRLRIIQRDLKPSNVVLDSELNPKISDFGMARIFGGSDVVTNTAKIVWNIMAPKFAMKGLYSVKPDVFQFWCPFDGDYNWEEKC